MGEILWAVLNCAITIARVVVRESDKCCSDD